MAASKGLTSLAAACTRIYCVPVMGKHSVLLARVARKPVAMEAGEPSLVAKSVAYVTRKAEEVWEGIRTAPPGTYKGRVFLYADRYILQRIRLEETLFSALATANLDAVQIIHPEQMDTEAVKAKLKHDARTGLAKHRFWLGVSCAVLPVTIVLFILPLLPNFLLYWNVWRIYSHNRAMNGAKRLSRIVHDYEVTHAAVALDAVSSPSSSSLQSTTTASTATAAEQSTQAQATTASTITSNDASTATSSPPNFQRPNGRRHQHQQQQQQQQSPELQHDQHATSSASPTSTTSNNNSNNSNTSSSSSSNSSSEHQHHQSSTHRHHQQHRARLHVSLMPDVTLQAVWDGTRTSMLTDQHIALLAGRLELSDDLLKRARIQVTKDQQQQHQQHHTKHPNYKQ